LIKTAGFFELKTSENYQNNAKNQKTKLKARQKAD